MAIVIGSILFVFTFVVLLLIYLGFVHLRYLFVLVKDRPNSKSERYLAFIKSNLAERKILPVLAKCTVIFIIIALIALSLVGPVRSYRLRSALQNSAILKVSSGNIYYGHRYEPFYETDDNDEIRKLVETISFEPAMLYEGCVRCGGPIFDFYDYNGEKLYTFSLQHDTDIRIENDWFTCYPLTIESKQSLANWFDEKTLTRKIQYP